MREITDYIDAAKARTGCESDRQFAKLLGIGTTTLFHIKTRRNWPGEDLMIRIAMLAGFDPGYALLELNIWKSDAKGLARGEWIELMRRLGRSAATMFLAGFVAIALALAAPSPARAAANFAQGTIAVQIHQSAEANVYYGKSRRRRRWAKLLIGRALCQSVMRLSQSLMRFCDRHLVPYLRRFAGLFIVGSAIYCRNPSRS